MNISTMRWRRGIALPSALRPAGRAVEWLVLLLVAGAAGCLTHAPKGGHDSSAALDSYMRVTHPDADTVSLQIALRRFTPEKGRGPVIWLAGASHIGESNYFAALQRHLDTQSLVLFEGVGAKSKKVMFNAEEDVSVQHTLAASLGLEFQLSAIDYDRPQFQNSDLTLGQLQQLLLSGRGAGDAGSANKASQDFEALLQIMDGSSWLGALVQVALKFIGSSPKLRAMTKVLLIETLGQLKGDMSQIKGVPPEVQRLLAVIIQERNRVVLDDLAAALRSPRRPPSISVFYGAGHMADLQQRLRSDLKYRPREAVWLTALSVNTREAGLSSSDLEAMRGLVRWQLESLQP